MIEELRRIKEAMVQEYAYDPTRIAADLQRGQQEHGHRIVDLQTLHKATEQEGSAGTDS